MLTRRDYLKLSALTGAASLLPSALLAAFDADQLITRAIPKSGEDLPIVGLGSSATFRKVAQSEDVSVEVAGIEFDLETTLLEVRQPLEDAILQRRHLLHGFPHGEAGLSHHGVLDHI